MIPFGYSTILAIRSFWLYGTVQNDVCSVILAIKFVSYMRDYTVIHLFTASSSSIHSRRSFIHLAKPFVIEIPSFLSVFILCCLLTLSKIERRVENKKRGEKEKEEGRKKKKKKEGNKHHFFLALC
jgi:hypothetical protein